MVLSQQLLPLTVMMVRNEESVSDDNAVSDSDPGLPGNLSFDDDEISESPLFQNSLPDDDVVLESDDSLSDD